jgi:hypothetical protein
LDGAWPVDQQSSLRTWCWILDRDSLLIIIAPRSEATFGDGNRVVGEVTSQDQRGPSRPEVIMMKRADRIRSHLADRVGLTAVHSSGSLDLFEHRGPEGNAGGMRGVGVGLFDLG